MVPHPSSHSRIPGVPSRTPFLFSACPAVCPLPAVCPPPRCLPAALLPCCPRQAFLLSPPTLAWRHLPSAAVESNGRARRAFKNSSPQPARNRRRAYIAAVVPWRDSPPHRAYCGGEGPRLCVPAAACRLIRPVRPCTAFCNFAARAIGLPVPYGAYFAGRKGF